MVTDKDNTTSQHGSVRFDSARLGHGYGTARIAIKIYLGFVLAFARAFFFSMGG